MTAEPSTRDPIASIGQHLAALEARVRGACERANRRREEVTVVAVSKLQPASLIRAAYEQGVRDFGENYAQELHAKARELADLEQIRWHFIGHLQRNKAQLVVGQVALIHSVSSTALIDRIDRLAADRGAPQDVLLQLNLSGELAKTGASADTLDALLQHCQRKSHISCVGLMTMPPLTERPADAEPLFARLRELRDERQTRGAAGGTLRHLSMGMSADFDVAIACGATMVRIGSAIFGPRPASE